MGPYRAPFDLMEVQILRCAQDDSTRCAQDDSGGSVIAIQASSSIQNTQMSLIDLVKQNIGPNELQNISQELGTDPGTAQEAVDAALPMMVGGMAQHAQQPEGAQAIHALSSGGGLGALAGAGGAGMGGILGSILG